MDESGLTLEQAKRIHVSLFPHVNYLFRLKTSMEKRGFRHDDPVYLAVAKTYDAAPAFYMRVHYLPCKSNVGSQKEINE